MAIAEETILTTIKALCPHAHTYKHRDQLSIIITADSLIDVAAELKENPEIAFDMLMDITAIDWLDKKDSRFEVVYFLYSMNHKSRIRLKVPLAEDNPEIPSVTSIWPSANWYERETFDMYGIRFAGHPGLRRFYMPEDYINPHTDEPIYPLRKDFPLMGIPDSLPLPPYPERDGESDF